MGKKSENVQVLLRCRPLSEKEENSGHTSCVELDLGSKTVVLKNPEKKDEQDRYTFDAVINNTFTQEDIFTQFIQPLVGCVMDGFNATVFAYGQSGSGKTYTMTGVIRDSVLQGVIPRCINQVCSSASSKSDDDSNKKYSLTATFVELYNGKVHDLLAKQQVPLDVRENKDHTFFVQNAAAPTVKDPEEIFKLMEQGSDRRRTAGTELNADSSRSHSLFTISLVRTEKTESGTKTTVVSKLNLVDLAGSERQGKTSAAGDVLQEGCNINLSLSALGTVIDTIVKGRGHVPYRSSQLTMLLKDSLGGNSKTVMFANINPSEHNFSETVSTLRFADRVKQIKNKPVVNQEAKDQKVGQTNNVQQEMKDKPDKDESGGTGALEKELEELRGKEDELKVALDNSQQMREADGEDHKKAVEKLKEELEASKKEKKNLEEGMARVRDELEIAEAKALESSTQAKDILQICTTYLRPNNPYIDAQDLEAHLRQLTAEDGPLGANIKDGKNSKEVAVLENSIQSLRVQIDSLNGDVLRKESEMQERVNLSRKELEKAEARIEKLKQELQESKENANAAAERAVEAIANAAKERSDEDAQAAILRGLPSSMLTKMNDQEAKALQEALASYDEKQFVNTDEFKKADAAMEDYQRGHLELQNSVARELSTLKKQLASRPVEGTGKDAEKVKALQEILEESDHTNSALMAEVAAQNKLLGSMRNVVKKTGVVPLSLVKGNKQAAETSLDVMVATDAKANEAQNNMLLRFMENLNRTQNQRNRILQAACADAENPALKGEVEQLVRENRKLREEKFNELRKMKRYLAKAREFTVQCVLFDGAAPGDSAINGSVSRSGSRAGMSRRGSLSSSRRGSTSGRSRRNSVATSGDGAVASRSSGAGDGDGAATSRSSGADDSAGDGAVASRSSGAGGGPSAPSGNEQASRSIANNPMFPQPSAAGSSNLPPSESSANNDRELKSVKEAHAKLEKRLAQAEAKAAKSKADDLTARKVLREMRSDFERMNVELKDSLASNAALNDTKEKLFGELDRQVREVNEEKKKNVELEGKLQEMASSYEQMLAQKKKDSAKMNDLDKRLRQRTEQSEQFRALLEKQKDFIEEGNKKLSSVKEQLKEAENMNEETKAYYKKLLTEKDENMQRVVNKRIAEYAARAENGKGEKGKESSKLKKRVKKMQLAMEEMEEQFDKKVIECEEAKRLLNEAKVTHLKHVLRESLPLQAEMQEQSDQIQTALDRAKQERQRKNEMFDKGEPTQKVGTGRSQRRNSRRGSGRSSGRSSEKNSARGSVDSSRYE